MRADSDVVRPASWPLQSSDQRTSSVAWSIRLPAQPDPLLPVHHSAEVCDVNKLSA